MGENSQLLAEGLDSHGIAERLHISLRTERNHMTSILAKARWAERLPGRTASLPIREKGHRPPRGTNDTTPQIRRTPELSFRVLLAGDAEARGKGTW
jgi:hypothetical protein